MEEETRAEEARIGFAMITDTAMTTGIAATIGTATKTYIGVTIGVVTATGTRVTGFVIARGATPDFKTAINIVTANGTKDIGIRREATADIAADSETMTGTLKGATKKARVVTRMRSEDTKEAKIKVMSEALRTTGRLPQAQPEVEVVFSSCII